MRIGPPTKLHGLTSQRTAIFIFTAVRTRNFIKICVMTEVLVTQMLNNHTVHALAVLGRRAGFLNKLDKLQLRALLYNGLH